MKSKYFINSTQLAKEIMNEKLNEGNIAIDATVGNGYDTLFIAERIGETGKVYGFDIQEKAIINTKEKLKENGYWQRALIIKDSHENMNKYIKEKVDFIIFNLGYLPGGNHNITTKFDTTIKAIKKSLNLLNRNGILLMVLYYGHENGKIEKEKVINFLESLDQKYFDVLMFNFINQKNNPPILIGVEKKKIGGF